MANRWFYRIAWCISGFIFIFYFSPKRGILVCSVCNKNGCIRADFKKVVFFSKKHENIVFCKCFVFVFFIDFVLKTGLFLDPENVQKQWFRVAMVTCVRVKHRADVQKHVCKKKLKKMCFYLFSKKINILLFFVLF